MGRILERAGRGGDRRLTAHFRNEEGGERSAGTFTSRREAERAWRRREHDTAAGERRRQEVARQYLKRYVLESWFPACVRPRPASPTLSGLSGTFCRCSAIIGSSGLIRLWCSAR